MSQLDGTGPLGQGPKTGRGMGNCSAGQITQQSPFGDTRGFGFGRGAARGAGLNRGRGRGFGRGFGFGRSRLNT